MRIAIITNSYKSVSELWIWRQTEYLGSYIGYVGIIGDFKKDVEYEFPVINILSEQMEFELIKDKKASRLVNSHKLYFLYKNLMSLEKNYNIDLYYIHYLTNAYLLKDFIEICSKKVFIHCHGYDITWNLKFHNKPDINVHSIDYLSFVSLLPSKVIFVANSEYTKLQLMKKNIPEGNIKILKFGCLAEGLCTTNENEDLKILYLGRLVDFKGPHLTIVAFEKACELGLKGELIMAGDGPLMVTCRLLKSRSKYSNKIKILGAVSYEVGAKLRKECKIFTAHNMTGILTNQVEAYGVSIIEAMGAGLPVVTGESGGIKETTIHNKTGLLFKPDDTDQHAKFLLELAKNKPLRNKMSIEAFKHVSKNFTIEREKKDILNIFNYERCNNYD